MANSSIETRRFLKKYSIQLLKAGIHVIKTTPFESLEFDISYEHLETKKTVETKVSFGLIVLTLFFTITGALFFFGGNSNISITFFLIALSILLIALKTKNKVVTIKSYEGHNIELYFTNKNKHDVLAFADTIINSTNTFLLNKFSKIDKDLPIDNQLLNLDFLRNKELISDEIYEQLKSQLLGRDNKKSIGYR